MSAVEIPVPGEGYTFAGQRYTVHELHLTPDSVELKLGPPLRVKGTQLELGLDDAGPKLSRGFCCFEDCALDAEWTADAESHYCDFHCADAVLGELGHDEVITLLRVDPKRLELAVRATQNDLGPSAPAYVGPDHPSRDEHKRLAEAVEALLEQVEPDAAPCDMPTRLAQLVAGHKLMLVEDGSNIAAHRKAAESLVLRGWADEAVKIAKVKRELSHGARSDNRKSTESYRCDGAADALDALATSMRAALDE